MFKAMQELKGKVSTGERGFTLVELLIVVAIIGILAAIAIPQFAAYRMRGFNAAANSDMRNMRTTEEALFADFQSYGTIAGGVGSAVSLVNPLPLVTNVAANNANTSLSNNVTAGTSSVADPTTGRYVTYVVVAKHLMGDRRYGGDAEDTSTRWVLNPIPATAILAADVPQAVLPLANELAAWTVM